MLEQLLSAGKSAGGAIQGAFSALGDVGSMVYASKKNLGSAQDSRRFQREMSNTAYQRAAKDLEAAGLNRILAVGSPASTPSAPTATTSDAKAGSAFSAGSSAASVRRVNDETIKLLQQQQAKTAQETITERERAANVAADTALKTGTTANLPAQNLKTIEETKTTAAQAAYLAAQAKNLGLEIEKNEFMKLPYKIANELLQKLYDYYMKPDLPPFSAKPGTRANPVGPGQHPSVPTHSGRPMPLRK